MLTQVTAAVSRREVRTSEPRKRMIHVPLLLFRRLKDNAIHEAKKTYQGLPTKTALLERAWIEQHCEPGWLGWETSFSNCCLMLGEEESIARHAALVLIDKHWHKALVDWGRRRRMEMLEEIHLMKASDNPAWSKHHAVQAELPMDEIADLSVDPNSIV